jgi:hypothetical protein
MLVLELIQSVNYDLIITFLSLDPCEPFAYVVLCHVVPELTWPRFTVVDSCRDPFSRLRILTLFPTIHSEIWNYCSYRPYDSSEKIL